MKPLHSLIVCSIAALAGAAVAAGPRIFVDKPEVDFGVVYSDVPLKHCFVIENRGDSPLFIEAVESCRGPCKSYVLETNAVPPGASARLRFSFDLYMDEGEFIKERFVLTNDPENPMFTVRLSGKAVRRFSVNPAIVAFDTTDRTTALSETARITSNARLNAPLSKTASSDGHFTAVLNRVDEAGGAYELRVSTVPPLNEGFTRGEITVSSADTNDPACRVRVAAYVPPAFCVMPGKLVFRPADEEQIRIIFVRQNTNSPISVLDVAGTRENLSCEIQPGPGDGDYRIYVHARDLSRCMGHIGDLVVKTDDKTRAEITVPVEVKPGVRLASGKDFSTETPSGK